MSKCPRKCVFDIKKRSKNDENSLDLHIVTEQMAPLCLPSKRLLTCDALIFSSDYRLGINPIDYLIREVETNIVDFYYRLIR